MTRGCKPSFLLHLCPCRWKVHEARGAICIWGARSWRAMQGSKLPWLAHTCFPLQAHLPSSVHECFVPQALLRPQANKPAYALVVRG